MRVTAKKYRLCYDSKNYRADCAGILWDYMKTGTRGRGYIYKKKPSKYSPEGGVEYVLQVFARITEIDPQLLLINLDGRPYWEEYVRNVMKRAGGERGVDFLTDGTMHCIKGGGLVLGTHIHKLPDGAVVRPYKQVSVGNSFVPARGEDLVVKKTVKKPVAKKRGVKKQASKHPGPTLLRDAVYEAACIESERHKGIVGFLQRMALAEPAIFAKLFVKASKISKKGFEGIPPQRIAKIIDTTLRASLSDDEFEKVMTALYVKWRGR